MVTSGLAFQFISVMGEKYNMNNGNQCLFKQKIRNKKFHIYIPNNTFE